MELCHDLWVFYYYVLDHKMFLHRAMWYEIFQNYYRLRSFVFEISFFEFDDYHGFCAGGGVHKLFVGGVCVILKSLFISTENVLCCATGIHIWPPVSLDSCQWSCECIKCTLYISVCRRCRCFYTWTMGTILSRLIISRSWVFVWIVNQLGIVIFNLPVKNISKVICILYQAKTWVKNDTMLTL